MSADNWTLCPKCGKDLREDYQIGIYEDKYEVEYFATCEGDTSVPRKDRIGCGFKFKDRREETIK